MILGILLLFATPVMAEGQFEMFEEICEITGEVKQRFVYASSFSDYNIVKPLDLEEN